MNELKQAIAVGQYPAPCFDDPGEPNDKQHRRFLRRLAQQGIIRLVDTAGVALDMSAVFKGAIHFKDWHVDAPDAQVILDQIEVEAAKRKEERQKGAEAARKADEERETVRRRKAEERKARRVELQAAGSWSHPLYKTLKAARAGGWHPRRGDELGGEEIAIKGHTLVRNTTKAQATGRQKHFVYKSTLRKVYGLTPSMIEELGEPDEYCENPHWKTGPFPASLYSIERVEAWIEENKERVDKAKASRANRSAAAKHVHDKKRAERFHKAKEWIKSLKITLERPLPDTLLAVAKSRPGKGLEAHVRHRLTNYESLLQELYDQEFSGELYPLLRERVDADVKAALDEWRDTARQLEPGTP